MITLNDYIDRFEKTFKHQIKWTPWEIIEKLENILVEKLHDLSPEEYNISDNIAIHKSATIEKGVTLKGTIIISKNCFIGANAYLRGPIVLADDVTVGPNSEIKQSIIYNQSAVAHLNYIGNSIIGKNVNFEAGSVCANHYNERENKEIWIKYNGKTLNTNVKKFGAIVGDYSKIGANAVLSPGTILEKRSIVKRLELVEQVK